MRWLTLYNKVCCNMEKKKIIINDHEAVNLGLSVK